MAIPPQEDVMLRLPELGGLLMAMVPLNSYVFVVALQADGVADKLTISHKISQLVVALDPEVLLKLMVPDWLAKLVSNKIYTSPVWAFGIFACSNAEKE